MKLTKKAISRLEHHDEKFEQIVQMGLINEGSLMDVVMRAARMDEYHDAISGMKKLQAPVSADGIHEQSLYGDPGERTLAIVVHNPKDDQSFVHLMAFQSAADYQRGVALQTVPDDVQVPLPA